MKYRLYPRLILRTLIFVALSVAPSLAQDDLKVYTTHRIEATAAGRMLHDYLTSIAMSHLDRREQEISLISSADQVRERQQKVRRLLLEMIGPFPERTPLEAQVTAKFDLGSYRVENVLFQSRPGFYVTSNLYLPPRGRKGPFPAVLLLAGHSWAGKSGYQRIAASLAGRGYAVLAMDAPGQGERQMYYDENLGASILKNPNIEHTLPGVQCLLSGSNVANYFVWDGIRALDYLETRPEVDPARLAVTGNSGGGLLSAYLGAFEPRLSVVVPSCYITSWRQMWELNGPQDAEQNLLPFVGSGLDFGDIILAAAPRAYLVNTAINDIWVPIVGARQTGVEAARFYKLLGAGDRFEYFEADDNHSYSRPRLEALYRRLALHLPVPAAPAREERPDTALKPELLRVTPTGQVITSYTDAETVQSLNARYTRSSMSMRAMPSGADQWAEWREKLLEQVRQLTGFTDFETPLNVQYRGSAARPGMKIDRYTFESEPGIPLPVLVYRPEKPAGDRPWVLFAADSSKSTDADGDIAALAGQGHTVVAPDLRGLGETASPGGFEGPWREWISRDWSIPMMAFQVRKTLVGMRAVDLVRALDLTESLAGSENKGGIVAVGKGSSCMPLLHAAALDRRISAVVLEGGLVSWQAVVEAERHRLQADNVVPGALTAYDLPSLAAALAPRPLLLWNLVGPMGDRLATGEVEKAWQEARQSYNLLGAGEHLSIGDSIPDSTPLRDRMKKLAL